MKNPFSRMEPNQRWSCELRPRLVWGALATVLVAHAPKAQSLAGGARLLPYELEVREVVEFKLPHLVTDPDQAVFVLGSLPELGGSDLSRSIQLVSADDLHWRVAISLPTDRHYTYQYLLRSSRVEDLGDLANGTPLTPELRGKTLNSLLGPGTKTFQVHTSLVAPLLHWRQDDGVYATEPLELVGAGRTPSELRFGSHAFATGQRAVEFYLTSADGSVRDPSASAATYVTPLDKFFLQDGAIYSYVPAATVSPTRLASPTPHSIQSSILGTERKYRVMLPRGYDEHTGLRYPVVYVYDGQTAWSGSPAWPGVWDRNGTRMAALVETGEVGEMIQVALDYVQTDSCSLYVDRGHDCLPPEDTVDLDSYGIPCGTVTGMGDLFLGFVVQELKPLIDATNRTRPDRRHTFATGYSFGGIYAMHAGWHFSDTFSAIASQSPDIWGQSFLPSILVEPRRDLRIYLDVGDIEHPDISSSALQLRESLLLRDPGYTLEGDLRFRIGFGHSHTFTNGGRRMASMMTFLWPGTREAAEVPW